MAQYNPFEQVFGGSNRQYYSYDDELYTSTFPFEWTQTHKKNTGPKECRECAYAGSYNGVFIGYCVKCADLYDGERGPGFIEQGEEYKYSKHYTKENSVFNTYLKDITLDSIGDKDFYDSANEKMIKIINEINNSGLEAYDHRDYNSENYDCYYEEGYDSF
jgi:hypothetical protein